MKRLPGLAAIALVAATVAGCSGATSTVAGAPAPVGDSSSPPTSASHSASASPSPTSPATPVAAGAARTLVLPPLVRDQIIATWVAGSKLERGDVAGISPGTGYYGYMPSTGTYWATARFDPTAAGQRKVTASPDSPVGVAFQDGPWVFTHQRGQRWQYLGDTGGVVCSPKVPAPMLAAWVCRRRPADPFAFLR